MSTPESKLNLMPNLVPQGEIKTHSPGTSCLSVGGINLSYLENGKGPLVLLLHGFPDTAYTWKRTLSVLADNGYRGVALFMRGYEPSDIPADGDYTIKSLATDVLSLVAQFGEEKAALVGHDWGAHAAYAAAAIGAERLSCICTLAIAPYPLLESGVRELCARPHNLYLGFGKPACWWLRRNDFREIDRLYKRWSPHWRVPDSHIRKVKSAFSDPARTQAALGYYSAPFSDQDRKAIVRNIEVPTLVIYGTDIPPVREDSYANASQAVDAACTVKGIRKVGHWPHLEAPDLFEQELLSFLRVHHPAG